MKKINIIIFILTLSFCVFSQNDTLTIAYYKRNYIQNKGKNFNDTINNFLKKNETFTGVIRKQIFEKYDGYGAEYLENEDFTNCKSGKKIKTHTIIYDNDGNEHIKEFSNLKDTTITIQLYPNSLAYSIDTSIYKMEDFDHGGGYIQKRETFRLEKRYGFDERKIQTSFEQVRRVLEVYYDGLQVHKSYYFNNNHSDSIEFNISTFYDKGKLIDVLSKDALFLDLEGKLITKEEYLNYLKNDDDLYSKYWSLDLSYEEQFLIKKMPILFYLEGRNKKMLHAEEKKSVKENKDLSKWLKKEIEKANKKSKK